MSNPVEKPSSLASQAYDHFNWLGQKTGQGLIATYSAIASTASAVKWFLEFGVHDLTPQQHEQLYPTREVSYEEFQSDPRITAKMNQALAQAKQQVVTRFSVFYAADYGLIPPLTEEQKQLYRGIPVTSSQEAVLNVLYRMDPETGHIYERATEKLIPKRSINF